MQPEENPAGKKKDKTGNKTILGSLGVLGVLALKFKFYLMAALKMLSFIKVGWILSPILTIGFYAVLFGLPYAAAIFVILVIHEMGHWVWMKALGLEPKMPVFLPFIAYVAMTKLPPDEATRAWVAIAGPLVGGVGSVLLFWFGVQNNNSWMMAAGNTGFFLNLFQLVPAMPFDGGFIIKAISKWLLIPGVAILIGLTVLFKSPLLFFIAIISIVSLFGEFTRQRAQGQQYNSTVPVDRSGYVVEKPKEGAFDRPGQQTQSPFPDQAKPVQPISATPVLAANTLPSSF